MIKIIGDLDKAQKALGTNIKLRKGQMLKGNDVMMKELCQKHPDLFSWDGNDWSANMKKAPSKNKMMDKNKIKSKISK